MQRRISTSSTSPREPIRRPLVWVLIGLTILAGVPWYLPSGLIEPVVAHLPGWFWLSIIAAVALSAVTCWACLTQWELEPHDGEDVS